MARIRYIKPSLWKDEDIAELSHQTRLFYIGLWNFADRDGRLEDRPKWLKVEIFPYEKADIEKMLQELSKPKPNSYRPFIQRYEINNKKYIQILSWSEHQNPHHQEQDSKIPPAPPYSNSNGNSNGKYASTESLTMHRTNTEVTPKKDAYGEDKKVKLSKDEYNKLEEKLGSSIRDDFIDRLNDYLCQKGKHYKSHYHTILTWARKDGAYNKPRYRKFDPIKPEQTNPEGQKKIKELVDNVKKKLEAKR